MEKRFLRYQDALKLDTDRQEHTNWCYLQMLESDKWADSFTARISSGTQ